MRVGILIPDSSAKSGGYQYSLSVIDALLHNNRHEYYIFINGNGEIPCKLQNIKLKLNLDNESLFINLLRKVTFILNMRFPLGKFRIIDDLQLHLLLIPQTAGLVGCFLKIPYITCIHDLMFKYYTNLPEFPMRVRIRKDITCSKAVKNAVFTIVDSEEGREDLIKFYKIDRERIKIIPFIPPPHIYKYRNITQEAIEELISKYHLPDKFIFYPSQFWFGKNHVRLIKVLNFIQKKYKERIPIVLVGADKGNLGQVKSIVDEFRMKEQFHYLGCVSNEEIVALYKRATALIFPSLFGPTNIPILEAFVLGTPVACSNLFSMPEQVNNAGLLFDPFDIEDMAEKIYTIWRDEKLRNKLVQNGYNRAKNISFDKFAKKWNDVIEEALEVIS